MYAVVRTGGKQYKMAVNELVRVEKLPGEKGDEVSFPHVLMVAAEDGVKTGMAVENARVVGSIVRQDRERKILVFKKRRRKNYRRKNGHRQSFTEVRVVSIDVAQ